MLSDDEIREFLAGVDPQGDPYRHRGVLWAITEAVRRHQHFEADEAEDGVQEILLWLHRHPNKLRKWSASDDSTAQPLKWFHDALTDAVRRQQGDDYRPTINGKRQPRVYPKVTVDVFSDIVKMYEDDEYDTYEEAVDRALGAQPWSDVPCWLPWRCLSCRCLTSARWATLLKTVPFRAWRSIADRPPGTATTRCIRASRCHG